MEGLLRPHEVREGLLGGERLEGGDGLLKLRLVLGVKGLSELGLDCLFVHEEGLHGEDLVFVDVEDVKEVLEGGPRA